MYGRRLLTVQLVCPLVLASAGAAMAQVNGFGARAAGMGGAFVAVADDPTGPMWNPAGSDASGRFTVPLGAFGTADGFDADEIKDLIDDIDDTRAGNLAAARSLFATAAQGRNIRLDGTPYLALGPIGGLNLYVNGVGTGMATLVAADDGDAVLEVGESVRATATVGAVAALAVTYNVDCGDGWSAGVAAKALEFRGRGFDYLATLTGAGTIAAAAVSGNDTGEVEDSAFSLDLGFLYRPPDGTGLSFGLVARDLTRPHFNDPTVPGSAFALDRQIDVGVSVRTADGLLVAADLHDLSGSRTGAATLHLGAEKQLNNWLTARVGLHQLPNTYVDPFKLVGGIGVKCGSFRLDLATSTTVSEYLAGEVSWAF